MDVLGARRIAIDGAEEKRNARARLESARRTEESREARERANRVPRKEPATGGGAVSAVGSSSLSASESDGGRNTTSWYSVTDDDGASSAAPGGDPGGARLDIPRADGTRARRGEVNARGAPRSVPLSGGGGDGERAPSRTRRRIVHNLQRFDSPRPCDAKIPDWRLGPGQSRRVTT